MDLGLSGRRAIVCASSRGLGFACARSLAREGCEVVINGRTAPALEAAAAEIAELSGRHPTIVMADLSSDTGRAALLAACPEPDILITNNGGPAPGELADWDHDAWLEALEANMLAAILLIRSMLPGMRARRFGRIVNITSAMVKSPQGPMGLSTAARAGLTAFSKAMSRDVARDNVTINNLLPERFDTGRIRFIAGRLAQGRGKSLEDAMAAMEREIPARRLGRPSEFGDACAFLCAAQAGYISGQNLQMDGGSYAGLI